MGNFWQKLTESIFINLKNYIFNLTNHIIRIYKSNHCKIDSIEKSNDEYLITFYYVGKRQIFIKSATQIHKNRFLLNEFSADEAALIGLYSAISHNQKIRLNKK